MMPQSWPVASPVDLAWITALYMAEQCNARIVLIRSSDGVRCQVEITARRTTTVSPNPMEAMARNARGEL